MYPFDEDNSNTIEISADMISYDIDDYADEVIEHSEETNNMGIVL